MTSKGSTSRRMFLTGASRSPVSPTSEPNATGARVVAISDACLARIGVFCMSCRDACPEQAILFPPRLGGAFLPEVATAACTGCGACLPPCPARALSLAVQTGEHPADA